MSCCGWHMPAFGEIGVAASGFCAVVLRDLCPNRAIAKSNAWRRSTMRWESGRLAAASIVVLWQMDHEGVSSGFTA